MPEAIPADYDFAELYPVSHIPAKLPPRPDGKLAADSSYYRWLNLAGTERRTLRSVVIGRHRYTCDRWLREFIDDSGPVRHHVMRTPAKKQSAKSRAMRQLEAAGI